MSVSSLHDARLPVVERIFRRWIPSVDTSALYEIASGRENALSRL